jgi:hypothetical protein
MSSVASFQISNVSIKMCNDIYIYLKYVQFRALVFNLYFVPG